MAVSSLGLDGACGGESQYAFDGVKEQVKGLDVVGSMSKWSLRVNLNVNFMMTSHLALIENSPAKDSRALDAKLIALVEQLVADCAREALNVIHEVTCAHYEFVGAY
jgi:hypothetical protein